MIPNLYGLELSDELKKLLRAAGLSEQQVNSKTAQVCARVFMDDDNKAMIAEAREQLHLIRECTQKVQSEYRIVKAKVETIGNTVKAIADAENEYGKFNDNKAKDALSLYATIMKINHDNDVSADVSAGSAWHVLWGYLGGGAINCPFETSKQPEQSKKK